MKWRVQALTEARRQERHTDEFGVAQLPHSASVMAETVLSLADVWLGKEG